jgi:hypothetical protein
MRPSVWGLAGALQIGAVHSHGAPVTSPIVFVQPSALEVPANLLRISIRFTDEVEGALLPRITLLHADGRAIQEPFLEQELWSPDGHILTILMHPGRVKSGLRARREMGPILLAGDDVSLTIDGRTIKRWRVGPVDEAGPIIATWKLHAVQAQSRHPLVVSLDGPIDGRDAGYLAIADANGNRVTGRVRLTNGESVWTFSPDRPWRAGKYNLVVRGELEDPAGNRPQSRFETPASSTVVPIIDAVRPFVVSSIP